VDLGAEQVFAAEKHERKIAVEVKSFIGSSIVADLEQALGLVSLMGKFGYKLMVQSMVLPIN